MAKIKVHPNDTTMFMYWDVATNLPNAFWVNPPSGPSWNWNGDFEKPTVSPSIRNSGPNNETTNHVFIRDGMIEYLSDCPHEYAGKTVPMIDFPDDW